MSLTAKESSGREPMEEGWKDAVCCWVTDLGSTLNPFQPGKMKNDILFSFEVPSARVMVEDKSMPAVLSMFLNNTLHAKGSMRKVLESWRGKSFTKEELVAFKLNNVVSAPCRIQVVHKAKADGSIGEKIANVMEASDGGKELKVEGTACYFDLDEGTDPPDALPAWIIERIHQSEEWAIRHPAAADGPDATGGMTGMVDGDPFADLDAEKGEEPLF